MDLIVKEVTDTPVLSQIPTSPQYSLNGPGILLAPNASVTDVDSPNFGGGGLLFTVFSSQVNLNRIQIVGSDFVIDADRQLLYRGLNIGREIVRTDLVGLKIEFNDHATVAIVQQLLRSIAFSTVGSTFRGIRTITVVVLDGKGGFDNAELRVRIV